MTRLDHIRLMADYNKATNANLYALAATLPEEALTRDRGAFFGSILGTFNHLAVGDTLWLKRLATLPEYAEPLRPLERTPAPTSLDQPLFAKLAPLAEYRAWLDALIVRFSLAVTEASLDATLSYANTRGVVSTRDVYGVIAHLFNHQTHHRGQVTTLLKQAGIDPGVTDLLAMVPDRN